MTVGGAMTIMRTQEGETQRAQCDADTITYIHPRSQVATHVRVFGCFSTPAPFTHMQPPTLTHTHSHIRVHTDVHTLCLSLSLFFRPHLYDLALPVPLPVPLHTCHDHDNQMFDNDSPQNLSPGSSFEGPPQLQSGTALPLATPWRERCGRPGQRPF